MRSPLTFLCIISCCPLVSAAERETVICISCRDANAYPRDFGNFAYNVSMSLNAYSDLKNHVSNGGLLEIRNRAGQTNLVDINAVTKTYNFRIFQLFDFFSTVTVSSLEIIVQRADGTRISYEVFAGSPKLTVGVGSYGEVQYDYTSSSSGSEGDSDESDPEEAEEFWYEEDDDDCSRCRYQIEEL